jgi:hypothetical protein
LKEAADVISESPAALQLRYLQTLNSIAAEKNSTIVFPVCFVFQKYYNRFLNFYYCYTISTLDSIGIVSRIFSE